MADRRLILRRDESVPLPNKMDQEIETAINRTLFHQHATAHIGILNTRSNAKGVSTAITDQNATAELAVQCCDIIIPAGRNVGKGVVDVEDIQTWERATIYAVTLARYMGHCTEGLQTMREQFEEENKGIAISTQVRWLTNPHTIMEGRQH